MHKAPNRQKASHLSCSLHFSVAGAELQPKDFQLGAGIRKCDFPLWRRPCAENHLREVDAASLGSLGAERSGAEQSRATPSMVFVCFRLSESGWIDFQRGREHSDAIIFQGYPCPGLPDLGPKTAHWAQPQPAILRLQNVAGLNDHEQAERKSP